MCHTIRRAEFPVFPLYPLTRSSCGLHCSTASAPERDCVARSGGSLRVDQVGEQRKELALIFLDLVGGRGNAIAPGRESAALPVEACGAMLLPKATALPSLLREAASAGRSR